MSRIVVLGGGVVGVTTALQLHSWAPSAQLALVADKFCKDTTSDGAAGIFRPSNSFSASHPFTKTWINDSYKFYEDLVGADCGVSRTSGYIFSSISPSLVRNQYLEGLVETYRNVTQSELEEYPGHSYGSFFTTLLIECRKYLPWALQRLKEGGVEVKKLRVHNLRELEGKCDVLVNCTGLGAQELCGDHSLVPIRGQVIKVEADWLDKFLYSDYDTYIIPSSQGVTVGGSRHYESYSTEECRFDGEAIMSRAVKLLPRLGTARRIATWVGLRPHRPCVRLETDIIGSLKVVHNYGHGGYGVTSAPGTAAHAVQCVQQLLHTKSKL